MGFFDFFKRKKEKPPVFHVEPDPEPTPGDIEPKKTMSAKKKKAMAQFMVTKDGDPSKRGPFKLAKEAQLDLCKQIACYRGVDEIMNHILKVYGTAISEKLVRYYTYSKKWKPLINKYREEYSQAVLEVAIANKRYRLEELNKIFEMNLESKNLKGAVETLKEARAEMEGGDKKEGGNSFYFTQINQTSYKRMSDEDIEKERGKQLENLQRIRGLLKRSESEHGTEELDEEPVEVEADVEDAEEASE